MVEESENPDLQIQAEERVDDGSSLDSFFKKKDKKGKKKKKTKVETNVDDIGEILKVKKKESDNKKENESQKDEANEEQEEWIDFEDESQRDYSDLKIQNLQINDGNEMPPDAPEYNEDGELLPPKPEDSPWKAVTTQDTVPAKPQEPIKEAPVIEAPKKPTAYRPPQARMSSTGGSNDLTPISLKRSRKQLQQAPEINNELDFPSLTAASNDTVQHRGFEMVKVGVKSSAPWKSNQQQNKSTGIELGNQFSALNTQ